MCRKVFVLIFCFFGLLFSAGKNEFAEGFALFDTTQNDLVFPKGEAAFETLYKKLDTLVFEGRGKIRILHIGGSHIQADVISGRIRERLATTYPAAASDRGFVFPYSAARTNTPSSYSSSYKGVWDMSKNVLKEVKKPLGVLGIAVSSEDPRAEFVLDLNRYNKNSIWVYNRARVFGFAEGEVEPVLVSDSSFIRGTRDSLSGSYVFELPKLRDSLIVKLVWNDTLWQDSLAKAIEDSIARSALDSLNANVGDSVRVATDSIPSSAKVKVAPGMDKDSLAKSDSLLVEDLALLNAENDSLKNAVDTTESLTDSLTTACADSSCLNVRKRPRFTVTGVLLENDFPGISYTSVGINGAKVSNYFAAPCPDFEKELQFAKPDLVIFAIGINDANVEHFNAAQFQANYDTLITRIRNVSPNVPILFVTNNDSYRKKRRRYLKHPNGELARDAFFALAEKYKGGVWDMFTLMGGLGSMREWEKAGYAKKDKVHFTHTGYVFLGDMFYNAFLKSYYRHIANLPAEKAKGQ